MRSLLFSAFIALAPATHVLAADFPISIDAFPLKFDSAARAIGSDIRIPQPQCTMEGVRNCVVEYGSVDIFVDTVEEGSDQVSELVITTNTTTPIHQIAEALEFTFSALHEDIAPIEARRMGMRVFENLIVTMGSEYSDILDNARIVTSEDGRGSVTVVITALDPIDHPALTQ